MSQKGYLVIADIRGYTAFLTQTELEHAQAIINDLLNTLLDHIQPPWVFTKLERNAVFAYALDGSFVQGQTLLEAIENLYCVFAMTQETMHRNTSCSCKACQLMTTLDLSFVIHYGTFSLTAIDGQQELIGPDVIVIRNLFNSPIAEKSGVKAYALVTAACANAMSLGNLTKGMRTYTESYEQIGEVGGFVYDLHPVWVQERERRRITVKPEDAWLVVDTYLPVSSALAWDYVTEPKFRRLWLKASEITPNVNDKGRVGIGTSYICSHGRYKINQVIIDWRPFEYLTVDTVMPMRGIQRHTTQLTPHDDGTRVTWRFDRVTGRNRLHTLLLGMVFSPMKSIMLKSLKQAGTIVREMIEAELTKGTTPTKLETETGKSNGFPNNLTNIEP
jgi:uncharacterized protein YndB with AHSA1/START domain